MQFLQIPATVPGGIYSDLQNAGILTSDIYYRLNEENYKWVAQTNWTYEAIFDLEIPIPEDQSVFLDCHGLDTVATLKLNEVEIGRSDNMFVRYKFPIETGILKQKLSNRLVVEFQSPIEFARQKFEQQSQDYIVPPTCTFPQGDCHANHIRKMQSSFG